MQRPRSESVREVKLRAACDRCHDLKNRCVRIGGAESRCERCERLDIDCVYRNTSSMGRPKRQKKTPAVPAPQAGQATAHLRMVSGSKTPEMAVTDAGGHDLDDTQMEADTIQAANTSLTDMTWDATSLVMSSEG